MIPASLAAAGVCAAAVLLDRLLGEPRRWHPLVGFGRLAAAIERRFNPAACHDATRTRIAGLAAVFLLVAPFTLLAGLAARGAAAPVVEALLLYLAIGARSLAEHARAVATPLAAGDLPTARARVAWLVSRETGGLDEGGGAAAATESVLENGADAVFAPLFWYLLAGAPGVVLHRLVNTLDAMWGYRTGRYRRFGWAAARLDDGLGWLPARATALTYAVLGHARTALACWRWQAPAWESPNAGPVMAAGAGALRVRLGGAASYHGEHRVRPRLGAGEPPRAADIGRAVALVRRGIWLWLALILVAALAGGAVGA